MLLLNIAASFYRQPEVDKSVLYQQQKELDYMLDHARVARWASSTVADKNKLFQKFLISNAPNYRNLNCYNPGV